MKGNGKEEGKKKTEFQEAFPMMHADRFGYRK